MQPAVPAAPELVVLLAPPLTGRAPAPPSEWTQLIIPNGPFSPPPPDLHDARSRRRSEVLLPRDRPAAWLGNAAIGLCALAAAAVSFAPSTRCCGSPWYSPQVREPPSPAW